MISFAIGFSISLLTWYKMQEKYVPIEERNDLRIATRIKNWFTKD